jgi:hypothetical protein
MWTLDNRTPYAAERNWVRGKAGEHHWIVAVAATFIVSGDGRLAPSEEQLPPLLAPAYRGEPGRSSLLRDSDLLGRKPAGTEVVVNAQAHAPGGRPVAQVPISLQVGRLRKLLLVSGERTYRGEAGLTTSSPRPFSSQPVEYERAYGGVDAADPDPRRQAMEGRNPVGRGFAIRPAHLRGRPAHTVDHYASGDPLKLGPAGFGPIDRWWSPRRELGGTYGAAWEAKKKPLLPDDYDERFELSAPRDQVVPGELRTGEQIELVNMNPAGRLRFAVPALSFGLATTFGRRREEHPARLATVIVEPEASRVVMVWQSALKVAAHEVEHLDRTRIVDRQGAT